MKKEKLNQILDSLYDRVIEPCEAKQQILDLINNIDCFDFDATELTSKEQFELRMLMSDGKIKIKIVL